MGGKKKTKCAVYHFGVSTMLVTLRRIQKKFWPWSEVTYTVVEGHSSQKSFINEYEGIMRI